MIFTIAGFVFTWEQAMYSALAYFIAYKTIDIVIQGLDESKSVYIISEHVDEVGEAIIDRLDVELLIYTVKVRILEIRRKLFSLLITRLEEAKLKTIVEDIDLQAFVAIWEHSRSTWWTFQEKKYSLMSL